MSEDATERRNVRERDRVDEGDRPVGLGDLDEREPGGIVVEAVPLRVDRDLRRSRQA